MRADGSIIINTKGDATGFNNLTKKINSGITGISISLKKMAASLGLIFGTAGLIKLGKDSLKATNELRNAMVGLKSILDGQGRSFAEAKAFINDYVSDGLIPATQAINAYKNLALRGYDDTQIQQVLVALKDSASFGRQASYTLGQAVESATEGLKNENSILVDNAGVTKNVAKMWEDYAKKIGVSTTNLTKQQKIQAEVLGIMEETRFQTGDAAKVAQEYSGQVLALGFNFNNLKIAIGNAILPIAWRVLPALNSVITALTRVANLAAQVTTALFGKRAETAKTTAKNVTAAADAENDLAKATTVAGKAVKGALAGFDELNVLTQNTAENAQAAAEDLKVDIAAPGGELGELGEDVIISPEVERAVNRFKELLQSLKDISFDNLNASFERLKKAVEPITAALFSGLRWAYENVFVPLSKWSMEVFLPELLDLWAVGFRVLSEVLEAFKPLGMWLWEEFLKPLGEWTGGLIISILEEFVGALNFIGDWIREHNTLIQDLALVLVSVAAAWGLVILAVAVWNVVGAIATGITTAFGVAIAFLTSPIGLVVLAIGAIIAVVLLLARHSDEAGQVFKNIWNEITETLTNTASWVSAWWDTTFKPIWDNILATLTWLWDKHIKGVIEQVEILVAKLIQGALDIYNKFITPLAVWMAKTFGPDIADAINLVIDIFGTFLAVVFDVAKGLLCALGGVIDFIVGVFTADWQRAWQGIKDIFEGIVDGIIGVFKGGINLIIDLVNYLISKLNTISFSIPDWVPVIGGMSWGINIPLIPKLATGAVIPPNAEFLAILGDQKQGRNIEAPEGLIRQIVREELENLPAPQVTVVAHGSASEIIRYFKFEIDKANHIRGSSLVKGVI